MQSQQRMGRPPLPRKQRKGPSHGFRLDADGEKLLRVLKRKLALDSDAELVRAALVALAKQSGVES